jgi:nucleotide-binding universal stress UspA family protein
MEKHLLVAVSEQQSAMCGIRFVGRFFTNKDCMRLTLFFTSPKPVVLDETVYDPEAGMGADKIALQYEARGRKAMEAAKKELVRQGFRSDQINTKLHIRKISKVMDLIHEGERGHYDAVVLGRRGLSWLEEAFEDSVSKGLLEQIFLFPLWLCKRPDMDRRNVLVCVDGSEAAFRMADHVGFILGSDQMHDITILMVHGKKNGTTLTTDKVLSKTKQHLFDNGVPSEMIHTKIIVSNNVAESILNVAEEGQFAAVALGRRKAQQGFLRKLFTGSVSSRIFRELQRTSLWISY